MWKFGGERSESIGNVESDVGNEIGVEDVSTVGDAGRSVLKRWVVTVDGDWEMGRT